MIPSSSAGGEWRHWWEGRYRLHGAGGAHYLKPWRDWTSALVRRLAMRGVLRRMRGETVFDYGCGPGGWFDVWLRAGCRKVWGYDFSPQARVLAQARGDGVAVVETPALVRSDNVVSVTVLQHMAVTAGLDAALAELWTHVLPGGRLVLLEYAPRVVPSFQRGVPYKRVTDYQTLVGAARREGDLEQTSPVSWIDGWMFRVLGDSVLSAVLSLLVDGWWFLFGRGGVKYRVMVFRKREGGGR